MRLTPNAHKDAVEGIEKAADGQSHVRARVRAVPEKGKANAALETLVAHYFGVPKSTVTVTGGRTGRVKTVLIAGDAEPIIRRLKRLSPARSPR